VEGWWFIEFANDMGTLINVPSGGLALRFPGRDLTLVTPVSWILDVIPQFLHHKIFVIRRCDPGDRWFFKWCRGGLFVRGFGFGFVFFGFVVFVFVRFGLLFGEDHDLFGGGARVGGFLVFPGCDDGFDGSGRVGVNCEIRGRGKDWLDDGGRDLKFDRGGGLKFLLCVGFGGFNFGELNCGRRFLSRRRGWNGFRFEFLSGSWRRFSLPIHPVEDCFEGGESKIISTKLGDELKQKLTRVQTGKCLRLNDRRWLLGSDGRKGDRRRSDGSRDHGRRGVRSMSRSIGFDRLRWFVRERGFPTLLLAMLLVGFGQDCSRHGNLLWTRENEIRHFPVAFALLGPRRGRFLCLLFGLGDGERGTLGVSGNQASGVVRVDGGIDDGSSLNFDNVGLRLLYMKSDYEITTG
jgi:hypothetical protein